MSWDVKYRNGILLPQAGWWLDAHFPVERSFVSHAHFDHLARHKEILCTEGTARLMRARMPARRSDKRVEHILPWGQAEQLSPDTSITLLPAGHIPGSAMCLLEHADHGRLLYTGDFKLKPGFAAEPCATPQADVLIMESTFGLPRYLFPPSEQVMADIVAFCRETLAGGATPVLFAYSLGKSQELLRGLSGTGLPVMLHPQTLSITSVCAGLGLRFSEYREFSPADLPGHVVICPPQGNASSILKAIPRRRTAVVTGWALDSSTRYRNKCDRAFPLSDHADFADLNLFVDLVKPRRVLTLHGFAQEFALHLRNRGIEAWAIDDDNQLELGIATAV